MNAEIFTVGDELLMGQVVNTNASWLGEQLNFLGIEVSRIVAAGDDEQIIKRELIAAFESAELIIITGGLGPTHDDVTKAAVASFFGLKLYLDEVTLERIQDRFARRGREMPQSNRIQAMVPEGFTVLPNPVGTAPGLWYVTQWQGEERLLAIMPGVPHEMKTLMQEEVIPRLRERKDLRVICHRTLLTSGIGESNLQEVIGDLSGFLGPNMRLAFLPSTSGVRLRMSAYGEARAKVEENMHRLEEYLRSRIRRFIYGVNDDTLEGVVGAELADRKLTISLAESCTGGYVTNRLTNVSGASTYVAGAIVAYSNKVKMEVLGVERNILEQEGAVSESVARQMAVGVRRRLGSDIGISTTGIAGPSGGTTDKPVGTVWVGLADQQKDYAVRYHLAEERLLNKELTSTVVLNLIRRHLSGNDV